ncbi:MAG: sigma-70 family RNA polymerase sigma factor, partial [Acidobacteriaceae bacterium]|nr:sigma-70 family RNA polymerase sigma factor [Acidobacteriaceae bacterium]
LVERQARFVFRVAYARLRNVQDSEDVVQQIFLKLYRSGAWERITDERAFLARAGWRMAGRRRTAEPATQVDESIASAEMNPEQSAVAVDWERLVHRIIDSLPQALREPLVLSSINDMSSGQIADILEVPEGTVRRRLMRARQLLRQKLAALSGRNL